MSRAIIVAGRRTPVMPKGGAFAAIEVADLGAAAILAALDDAEVAPKDVDQVIMGNALYGGGNPARVAALAAGLPETVPALSIDTQCCGGLDAIALAADRIDAGQARVVVAGGLESYSRAPIRQRRPMTPAEQPRSYERPPFTPWPDRDPDMIEAAATLAVNEDILRAAQETFAIDSHRRARADDPSSEIVPVANASADGHTRNLSEALCRRMPLLAGTPSHGVTAATTAVEADAAAAVVLMDRETAAGLPGPHVHLRAHASTGGDPCHPGIVPIAAGRAALAAAGLSPGDLDEIELMEAFAVQAMACIDGLGLDPARVNRRGGALARGHPIGASGAILAVRLFHALRSGGAGRHGLAAIAAAGGLGSATVLARETGE